MLDDLIRKTLLNNENLSGMLAKYDGCPAVFYGNVPKDTDTKWEQYQFPRIVFTSDDRYDPERKTAGVLMVDALCNENTSVGPEDVSEEIVAALSELFLTGEDTTICIVWNRTDAFTQKANLEHAPKEDGNTVTFDVLAFPAQETSNPDPIIGLNTWTKSTLPQLVRIGSDEIPESFRPTDENPAVYWRYGPATITNQSYSVIWVEQQIMGHFFCPSPAVRQRWIKETARHLALAGKIVLADGSPLILNRLAYQADANPLQAGQMTVTATYGVLTDLSAGVPLNHIHFSM